MWPHNCQPWTMYRIWLWFMPRKLLSAAARHDLLGLYLYIDLTHCLERGFTLPWLLFASKAHNSTKENSKPPPQKEVSTADKTMKTFYSCRPCLLGRLKWLLNWVMQRRSGLRQIILVLGQLSKLNLLNQPNNVREGWNCYCHYWLTSLLLSFPLVLYCLQAHPVYNLSTLPIIIR